MKLLRVKKVLLVGLSVCSVSLALLYTVLNEYRPLKYKSDSNEQKQDDSDNNNSDTGDSNKDPHDVNQKDVDFSDMRFGAYLPEALLTQDFSLIDQHEAIIEKELSYFLIFRAWGDEDRDFPTSEVEELKTRNIVPIITWEPWKRNFISPTESQLEFTFKSILNGEHDLYLDQWSEAVKEAETPIIIRFAHEQSTVEGAKYSYPWQGDYLGFVEAYRYIVDHFNENGVENVEFMWSPMWMDIEWIKPYYPGTEYVDYIGLTVINHGTGISTEWEKWRTCKDLLQPQLEEIKQFQKAVIITEFGSSEIGGNKGEWYNECLTEIGQNDGIFGLITLETAADLTWPNIDWRTNSSPEALEKFKEVTKK